MKSSAYAYLPSLHCVLLSCAVVICLGGLSGCGGDPEISGEINSDVASASAAPGNQAPAATANSPRPGGEQAPPAEAIPPLVDRPLDAALRRDFAAASRLPEDIAGFSAYHGLKDLALDFWQSRGVRTVLATPLASYGLGELRRNYHAGGFDQMLHSPLGQEVSAALLQLVEQESFVALGGEAPEIFRSVVDMVNALQMAGVLEGLNDPQGVEGPSANHIVESILERQQQLRIPSALIGFRLSDPTQVRNLIDQWLPALLMQSTHGTYTPPEAAADWKHRFRINASTLIEREREDILLELQFAGVDADRSQQLLQWLGSLEVYLDLALRDDYLLLSIASNDQGLLTSWNAENSLAASAAFKPLRALHQEQLVHLSYISPALNALTMWNAEDIRDMQQQLLSALEASPADEALKAALRQDLPPIVEDLAQRAPVAGTLTSATYRRDGLFTVTATDVVTSQQRALPPVTIQRQGGERPLLARATATRSDPKDYAQLQRLVGTACGYAERFLLPELPADRRPHISSALNSLQDFGGAIDRLIVDELIPAWGENGASLLLIAEGGRLSNLPSMQRGQGPHDQIIPRLAMVADIADPQRLLATIGRMAGLVEGLAQDLAQLPGSEIPEQFTLPPLTRTQEGDLVLYHYPELARFGDEGLPVFAHSQGQIAFATSFSLIRQVLQGEGQAPQPFAEDAQGEIARLDADIHAWGRLILAMSEHFLQSLPRRNIDPQDAAMVIMHLRAIVQGMATIAGYHSSTRVEGDHLITRSWLRLSP